MLEEEDEFDPDLFSADSGYLIGHLTMDEGTENLVRLPVDLLVKLRKCAWLANKWLALYDQRTYDLQTKLLKVKYSPTFIQYCLFTSLEFVPGPALYGQMTYNFQTKLLKVL